MNISEEQKARGQEGRRETSLREKYAKTPLVKGGKRRGDCLLNENPTTANAVMTPHPTLSHKGRGKRCAFTLAEVLITLGIIGVVAAMTLPALVTKYQQHVTVTRLKAFNSTMSQAFQRAKLDYGDFSNWDSNNTAHQNKDSSRILSWHEKYLLPYIKHTEVYAIPSGYVLVGLPNGSGFSTYERHYFFCVKFSDCKKVPETYNSRSRFIFQFLPNKGFGPYDYGWKGTRDEFFNWNEWHQACNKNQGAGLCAKLIEYDGWTIKKDYPW